MAAAPLTPPVLPVYPPGYTAPTYTPTVYPPIDTMPRRVDTVYVDSSRARSTYSPWDSLVRRGTEITRRDSVTAIRDSIVQSIVRRDSLRRDSIRRAAPPPPPRDTFVPRDTIRPDTLARRDTLVVRDTLP